MPEARDDLRWTGWAALAATAALLALLFVLGPLIGHSTCGDLAVSAVPAGSQPEPSAPGGCN